MKECLPKSIICHARGDRCHGCSHYRGESDICDWAKVSPRDDRDSEIERLRAELEAEKARNDQIINSDDTGARTIIANYYALGDEFGWRRDSSDGPFDFILARKRELEAKNARLREALTPSAETKAAYISEFAVEFLTHHPVSGCTQLQKKYIPWTTIKEIMAAILKHADAPARR